MRRLLAVAAVGVALSNLLYLLMAMNPGQTWAFVATLSGDNFAQGFAGPVLVAFMSGLVNRQFTAQAPNRLWVADATRIPCGEGVFWLAAVRDAFSNRIVGWRCSDRCDTDLILGALEYGIWSRDLRQGELIHHSDRGSNYTSFRFATRLADNGILASVGSTGDSYDNALMENFWSTLKIELVYRRSWRTRDEAENAIFAYIDGWYNTMRIQKGLDDRSPDEYEAAWYATANQARAAAELTNAP